MKLNIKRLPIIVMMLSAGCTRQVYVYDTDNNPVDNAMVQYGGNRIGLCSSDNTDSNGKTFIHGQVPGVEWAMANKDGYTQSKTTRVNQNPVIIILKKNN